MIAGWPKTKASKKCSRLFNLKLSIDRFRTTITIFPSRNSKNSDFRVWNPALIGYAGYVQSDGTVIGDPSSVEFTQVHFTKFCYSQTMEFLLNLRKKAVARLKLTTAIC